MRKLLLLAIFSIVVSLCAVGCIPVEDLGEYWNKGTIDSELEGHWKKTGAEFQSEDNYISFIKVNDHYKVKSAGAYMPMPMEEAPEQICKTLNTGNHKFLMFNVEEYFKAAYEASRKAAEKMAEQMGEEFDKSALEDIMPKQEIPFKGALQRYTVENDVLALYMLNDEVLAEQIKKGNVKGRSPAHNQMMGATISKLDNKTIQFLANLADEPKYWDQVERFEQIDDLEKALEESRKYPATEDTPKNTLVNIDLPDLKYFAEGKTHILLRHLQASPEWKVFIEGQRMVCHRRKKQSGRWNDGSNSFHHDFLDEYSKSEDDWFPIDAPDRAAPMNERNWQQMAYLFRFEQEPFGYHPTWAGQSHVMKISPLEGEINIKLKASDQGIESYMAIGQPGLWFEVFEQTWHEPRKKTRNALKLLKEFLRGIREAEEEIQNQGYASQFMPSGGVKKGKPTLEVKWDHGIYSARAWVDPGAQGYVYVKVFNLATKQHLSEEQMGWSTREYIGWSKNPNTLFLYSDRIGIRTSTLDLPLDARFELWLHPSDGGPERKLLEKTLKLIDGYEPPQLTFLGGIVNESNEPIIDVKVSVYRLMFKDGPYHLPEIELIDRTMSKDGSFEFTLLPDRQREEREEFHYPDKVIILAEKEGYASGWRGKSLYDDPNRTVVLKSPTQFIGQVLNTDSEPVSGAEVRLILTNERNFYRDGTIYGIKPIESLKTTTNEEGYFEFSNLPSGARAHFIVSANGYAKLVTTSIGGYPGYRDKAPEVGKSKGVSLRLSRLCVIEGQVVDKTCGRGVKHVRLSVKRRDGTLQPEKKELSCISGQDGNFRVAGLISGYYWVETVDDDDWKSKRTLFYVAEGGTVRGDIEVTKGGKLKISVRDADSMEVIPKVYVDILLSSDELKKYGSEKRKSGGRRALLGGELMKYYNTHVNGISSFILAEGKYKVKVDAVDCQPQSKGIKIVAGETAHLDYVLGDQQYSIVSVVDVNGEPMRGADPQFSVLGDRGPRLQFFGKQGHMSPIATDANSELEVDKGYFNRYEGGFFVVRDSKRNLVGKGKISKDFEYLEIPLGQGSVIKGRFVDEQGRGIPNVAISLYESDYLVMDFHGGKDRSFVSDEQGYFELRALLKDFEYDFRAAPEGHVYINQEIKLRTDELDLGEIVLERGNLTITGFVVDDMGRPVSDLKVGGFGNKRQPNIRSVKTDEQGKFTLIGVTDATVYVRTWSEDGEYSNVQKKCKGGDRDVKIVVMKE